MRWIAGSITVSGAFHAVSGATGLTVTQGSGTSVSPKGTNGLVLSGYRVQVTSADYGTAKAYVFTGLPAGLKGSLQGVITGTPTETGAFAVRVTGYEKSPPGGYNFAANVSLPIADQNPVVVRPPTGRSVAVGTSVTFDVAAEGTSLKYRWLKDDIELAKATNDTYTVTSAPPASAGSYKVRVSNAAGVVISAAAVLTVTATGPTILVPPAAKTVHEGEPVSFQVTAEGAAPLTYQWSKDGMALPGSTDATLLLAKVSATDAGDYSVAVAGPSGTTTTSPVKLTVVPPLSLSVVSLTDVQTTLSFGSITGRNYVLESTDTLGTGAWTSVLVVKAAGPTTIFNEVPGSSPFRFWRVRTETAPPKLRHEVSPSLGTARVDHCRGRGGDCDSRHPCRDALAFRTADGFQRQAHHLRLPRSFQSRTFL